MSLETHFSEYPNLKAVFWPEAMKIKVPVKHQHHPLLWLIQSTDERSKRVAGRTDHCCRRILQQNPNWIKRKAAIVTSSGDMQNVSATLGEIRAYGELLSVWEDKVIAGKSGHDFTVKDSEYTVRVEVFTIQHRPAEKSQIKHALKESKRVVSQVTEIAPFGWPERPGKDNVQGEAVSKLAQMKGQEDQFLEEGINILWCDLKDPALWIFGFPQHVFTPLSAFQERITSGPFWHAFYAKKGTPVFDGLRVGGCWDRNPYLMEFEGRFWNKTKLDFVIADTADDHIVFQNPNRPCNAPDSLFRALYHLFAFNLEASWLDWPCKGHLGPRIDMTLKEIAAYKEAFAIWE